MKNMNKNEYFYVNAGSIANKKQDYFNLVSELQFNGNKLLKTKDELNEEIIRLNEEIIYINEELKNINKKLSQNELDRFVVEEDFIRLMKRESVLFVTEEDFSNLANIIEILKSKKIKLMKKKQLLIIKKKLLKEKISNNGKIIKDINIDIKYNNINILALVNSLYMLDDIALSGVEVVKESKITPKIKKRRNK